MLDISKICDAFSGLSDSSSSKENSKICDSLLGSIFDRKSDIAVVDSFGNKNIDVDGDKEPDISHGESITRMIKGKNPDAEVSKFEGESPEDFNKSCEEIADRVKNGEEIDGVNMSLAQEMNIDELAEKTDLPLDKDNLSEYKDEIKQKMKESDDPKLQTASQEIESIEKITETGTPVYISGGNSGEEGMNLFNLADGTENIGSKNADYSASNSLIDKYEKGDYQSKKVSGGYDFTDDGEADVSDSEVSGGTPIDEPYLSGTSYSSPTALAEDTTKDSVCDKIGSLLSLVC
ncbi:MAG: hypothetical protein V2B14_07135 [bacterium]